MTRNEGKRKKVMFQLQYQSNPIEDFQNITKNEIKLVFTVGPFLI